MKRSGWGGRPVRAQGEFGRIVQTSVLGLFAAAILMAGLGSVIGIIIGLTAVFGALWTATTFADRRANRRAGDLVRALDGDGGEAVVRTTYSLPSGFPTLGHDEGLIFVEDGWLVFRGRRTEWAVRTTDTIPLRERAGFAYPGVTGATLLVRLEAVTDPAFVDRLLYAWRVERRIDGLPVLPPGVVAPERRRWTAPAWALAWALVAFTLSALLPTDGPFLGGVVGLLVLAWFAVSLVWRLFARFRLTRAGAWSADDQSR